MVEDASESPELCARCRYFERHTVFDPELRAIVNLKTGDCRRDAPRFRQARDGTSLPGAWPTVTPRDFCGQWRDGGAG